jgi:hypothetical protein
MEIKEYLILLVEVVVALWLVGWSLGFAVAAVVGAFHEARHCDKCTVQKLDTYDEGTTEVQPGDDMTVYRSG